MLDALHVADVVFEPPPTVPQTGVERMIYGDHRERAAAEADRRLHWPRSGDGRPAVVEPPEPPEPPDAFLGNEG